MVFAVADRVRVIASSELGSVVETGELVVVLLDGSPFADGFDAEELEHDDTEFVPPAVLREGLPGVGDALLAVAGALKQLVPAGSDAAGKIDELFVAIKTALPTTEVRDSQGNGWKRCGPDCDLAVVEPGKTACTGIGGCTR